MPHGDGAVGRGLCREGTNSVIKKQTDDAIILSTLKHKITVLLFGCPV